MLNIAFCSTLTLLFCFCSCTLRVQFLFLYFSQCILSLCLLLWNHTTTHHSSAVDLQLQISVPDEISVLLILVTTKRTKHLHNSPVSITIGNAKIPFKETSNNLGLTLDCHLALNAHVSNIARTCYVVQRRLASICRFLTSTAAATLVSAFVLSRIDYCNSLLFGSIHDVTSHLQRIQNYAARVILRLPISNNINTHLKSPHWLPVKVRRAYKVACLCYHCHRNTAPLYVTDVLQKSHHTPETLAPAHTPCFFTIDLHTVRQHLVTSSFPLLLLLSEIYSK